MHHDYAGTPRAPLDASAELWVYPSISEQASHVTQPVLVIAGAREPLYHPEFQRLNTLAFLPHATKEFFDGAHFIPHEEPAALAQSGARFCASLPD